MSPDLFTLYSENMRGIKMFESNQNMRPYIKNMRYTTDTVLVVECESILQKLLNNITKEISK